MDRASYPERPTARSRTQWRTGTHRRTTAEASRLSPEMAQLWLRGWDDHWPVGPALSVTCCMNGLGEMFDHNVVKRPQRIQPFPDTQDDEGLGVREGLRLVEYSGRYIDDPDEISTKLGTDEESSRPRAEREGYVAGLLLGGSATGDRHVQPSVVETVGCASQPLPVGLPNSSRGETTRKGRLKRRELNEHQGKPAAWILRTRGNIAGRVPSSALRRFTAPLVSRREKSGGAARWRSRTRGSAARGLYIALDIPRAGVADAAWPCAGVDPTLAPAGYAPDDPAVGPFRNEQKGYEADSHERGHEQQVKPRRPIRPEKERGDAYSRHWQRNKACDHPDLD